MAGISAAAVKSLREKTGLPMMECKKALVETSGDEEGAIRWLRENGVAIEGKRQDRVTEFGRFGVFADFENGVGAMVELKCESASVTQLEDFILLAEDMAKVLAEGPGAATPEELLAQPSTIKPGTTLGELKLDLFNRVREVFNIGRMIRIDAPTGGYSHNSSTVAGVLIEVEGGDSETAKDVSMHIAAMRPSALNVDELDPKVVENERSILTEAARNEGKPDKIIEKMVEGRLRNFYAESVLLEQPFVKDDKQSVGNYAKEKGMKVKRFVHWQLGEGDQSEG
ncbi:translation elongation factor Ts [Blastopirellula marina]|uniref:Elongation factor Ts n=1 Tax=Blastopirellula marina DSM 3645 TaxID=314230 RepID=A3ZXS1_9BACT|nr:translation elongation factor Ts [Blastopirellula marina]EAQ78638.1 elongation factor Ts [Blastopirellula marina DSM 3645]